jgi:molybdopterin-containing oxidoreductase family membrane subunit
VKILGAVYAMLLVFAHLLVTSDLAMSLVPGWQSANFPAYHAVAGLQGGVATVVVGLAVLRRRGARVRMDVFHACGKLLLALALLWFYFSWAEFLTYWYGRTPAEQDLIALLMGRTLYAGAALGCCVLPFLVLLWNRPRASVTGVTLAAILTLIGTLLDQVRVFVPAWRVAGPVQEQLGVLPELSAPSLADLLVLIGAPALVLLLVALVSRGVPPIAVWEEREADLLRAEQPYLRTRVSVVGRPG